VSKFRGLPQEKHMRHDTHFVEEVTSGRSETVGRMLDIARIEPNPNQPRKEFGDLTDLVDSVKEKGILEPILVRSHGAKFQIIAGERRFQAAKIAGLRMVPCIEIDVDLRGMLEISLIENLQRKDLHPFEEAEAIQSLTEQFRYTHEEIARKLGKSRPVITEALSLCRIPEDVRERCRQADITSKSMLLQVARQPSVEAMNNLIDRIQGGGITRDEARRFNKGDEAAPGRPRTRGYTFRYQPQNQSLRFTMTFDKAKVERGEVIERLKAILQALIEEELSGAPVEGAASDGGEVVASA
jgi:ParB family transcriptional regulator, chromosome partitioning protein